MIAALCFDPLPLYLAGRADPGLNRVPLVCAEEQRVVHANSVAKRHGISVGMRLDGARMRVTGLEVVSYTEPDLQHAWHALLRELHEHTPWLESGARGRVFARLDAQEARELAARYQVRVGLADDCETAELASLASRPGDCRRADDDGSFLARLPLRFLRGIGVCERNLTRLQWLGVATAGELAAWTASQVRSYLGEEGERLLPYLHGPRRSALLPFRPPSVITRTLAFSEPVREPYRLLPALDRLAGELEGALSGRAARRLTLTANLPSGTLRASRLSKRPLTQARHIRQQALFALRDSNAEGHDIERLTVELAAPERIGLQPGLWPRQERRQRAFDSTFERFPNAPRRLAWHDPHAQAGDLAWSWQAYSSDPSQASEESSESAASAAGATGAAARKAARRAAREAAANAAAFEAAGGTAAVPLFGGSFAGAGSSAAAQAASDLDQAPSDPATYADLLFMPTYVDHQDRDRLGDEAVPSSAPTLTSTLMPALRDDPDESRFFSSRPRQHYTEAFAQEEHHATVDEARNRGHRKPTTDRGELVQPPERAAA